MKINKRKIQYASLSSVFIVLFVVVVMLLNLVVGFVTERFSLKLDLTENGEYSITDETKKMLDDLDEEITIYIMSSEANVNKNEYETQAVETIRRFTTASGGKVKSEFVDPNQNPKFYDDFPLAKATKDGDPSAFLIVSGARRYSSILYKDIVATNQNNSTFFYSTEAEVAGAIMHVVSEQISKVATITGHDEVELTELNRIIDGNGFERIQVDLGKEDIPDTVNNVIIAAPSFDYTPEEIAKIDKFLRIPGNNVYVFWQITLTQNLPVLERFLADWGFAVEPSCIILDQQYAYKTPTLAVCDIVVNDATARIPETQQRVIAPMAHPIKLLFEQRSSMRVLPIVTTANTSYARLLTADANITEDRTPDEEKGPFVVAAVSEKIEQTSTGHLNENRVFLFSSEGMADEEIMSISLALNNTLLTELISYANPDAATMSIAPKMTQTYDLNFYESEVKVLKWILVIILPILILAAGIFIFIRRRHR